MSPERFDTIQNLYLAALRLPPAERAPFLDEACTGDDALRREVDSLLAVEANSFLAQPLAHVGTLDEAALSSPLQGHIIGSYRLLHELGRGGMGVVYLAERADGQFEQRVALKLVRRSLAGGEGLRRFLGERQILAQLEHQNIARLLDGGVTADQVPYFVMEYVDGQPITAYCDRHLRTVQERLELFLKVCEAVQYAHQNLVVHRDLKPSNILVSDEDRVKLLDFGIAKVLEQETPDPPVTQTGARVMTPEYAAPEQVLSQQITTATDVYALGLLLYELLTGHHAHRFDRYTAGAIEHAVLEEEPLRPSTAVGRTENRPGPGGTITLIEPADVAAGRRLPPERLRRRLAGDLDTIVLKALRKEPDRRYASVEALADDIRRYQQSLPVYARPDTVGYRTYKFVRRHRLGVVAAVAICLLAIGMVTVTLRSAAQVSAALQETQREAEKAAQVSAFLVDLFSVSNPFSSEDVRGDTLTARTLLARGAQRVEHDLARQPDIQAEMLGTIGQVYFKLNMFAEADSLLHHALEKQRMLAGQDHPAYARAVSALGQLRQNQGEYAAAERLHREALQIRQSALEDEHLDVAESQHHLAMALTWQSKNSEEAEQLIKQALHTRRQRLGPKHLDVAYTLNSLGNLFVDLKRLDEAEAAHREVLEIRRELLDAHHPSIAISINNLAYALRTMERYEEAAPLYREALGILRKELQGPHTYIAIGLNNLADVMARQGKHAEAEPLFKEALGIFPALSQEGHALEAVIMSKWGESLVELGRLTEAEEPLLKSEPRIAATFGADHPFARNARERLLRLYERWERQEEAARWRAALASTEEAP